MEFDPEKFEYIGCQKCGGEWYYEPRLRHGTRYEATSGWKCTECSWSKIDPASGMERPSRSGEPDPEVDRQKLGVAERCDCGSENVGLGRRALLDDDDEYVRDGNGDVVVQPIVECPDCFTTLDEDPSEKVVEYLS